MTLKDDLISSRDAIVGKSFDVRNGIVVPTTEDVGYDQAVKLAATYLYADMVDSSGLVALSPQQTVGKVLRLFLDSAVRIIRHNDGHIRSFDGDRVMGIFIGDGRQDRAVKSAMQIKWACLKLLQPSIASTYRSIREGSWQVRPGCGIASGEALLVRGGVRRANSDLVSVGVAPNLAAKLSDVRDHPYHTRIAKNSYGKLSSPQKVSNGKNMWSGTYNLKMGGKSYPYYRTSYHWSIA